MSITIIGLGPGDGRYLTRQAWAVLKEAAEVHVRTARHPSVGDLPSEVTVSSFDHFYESAATFAEVYERITNEIVERGKGTLGSSADVIYAVPGHPMIGEATVPPIIAGATQAGIKVSVIPGLSFLEPTLTAIGLDGLDGLQLFDAVEIGGFNHPPANVDLPLLLGQVYNRRVASDLKLALMALYPDEHEVTLIHEAGGPGESVERLPLFDIDRDRKLGHLTSLYVPPLPYAGALPALAETVAYLRGPDGCPWDQEQTRRSLRPGFLEESAEVMAALDSDDSEALREELGDLLFHIVIQAQIASELGEFNLSDVIAGIEEKLKRRHPHVWGDWEAPDRAAVMRNWEQLKEMESTDDSTKLSVLDNISHGLPALARAQKIQARAKGVGFDWLSIDGVQDKVQEELAELREAASQHEQADELGDVLFAVVNLARWLGIDAEITLRDANSRFERRFRHMEQTVLARGMTLAQLDAEKLNVLWEQSKIRVADRESNQLSNRGNSGGRGDGII